MLDTANALDWDRDNEATASAKCLQAGYPACFARTFEAHYGAAKAKRRQTPGSKPVIYVMSTSNIVRYANCFISNNPLFSKTAVWYSQRNLRALGVIKVMGKSSERGKPFLWQFSMARARQLLERRLPEGAVVENEAKMHRNPFQETGQRIEKALHEAGKPLVVKQLRWELGIGVVKWRMTIKHCPYLVRVRKGCSQGVALVGWDWERLGDWRPVESEAKGA